MALWAPALYVGACLALNGRFSASRSRDDVRRFGATRYLCGKALAYVLRTRSCRAERELLPQSRVRHRGVTRDRSEFERRFGCTLVEGYGSSEGGVAITRTPDTPPDALGTPAEGVAILDPETGEECKRAVIGDSGVLENSDEAIGELASRSRVGAFEGYFKNPEADTARVKDGWYWTGDLAYRDEAGFVYFAGRKDDWLGKLRELRGRPDRAHTRETSRRGRVCGLPCPGCKKCRPGDGCGRTPSRRHG